MSVEIRQKPKDSGIWWVFVSHGGKRASKEIGPNRERAMLIARRIQSKLMLLDKARDRRRVPFTPDGAEAEDSPPLQPEQIETFLCVCGKRFPEYYPFFLCAVETGLRMAELRRLAWGDIDWSWNYIEVRRIQRDGPFGPMVAGSSRQVVMPMRTKEVLSKLLMSRKTQALYQGGGETPDEVFLSSGGPLDTSEFLGVFKKILTSAKIPDVRFHKLREARARQLLRIGNEQDYVDAQLGYPGEAAAEDAHGASGGNGAASRHLFNPESSSATPA